MVRSTTVITVAALALAGCATPSKNIQARTVPIDGYLKLSCADLLAEETRVEEKRDALGDQIGRRRTSDDIVTGVGIFVAWPALFFIKGNYEVKGMYGYLLGKHETLMKAYDQKGCTAPS
jgi:hypothetical protein